MRRKIAAGNWKMHGTKADLAEIAALVAAHGTMRAVDIVICPPATLLSRMADLTAGGAIRLGGQSCHAAPSGAHTGDISAPMLRDAGADYVIVGHSERRADHAETDAAVRAQAIAAQGAGLTPIICLGESHAQRAAGEAIAVVCAQMDQSLPQAGPFVIAYEPIWAIGTGLVPRLADITEIHAALRARLTQTHGRDLAQATPILYGGSVKPENARDILGLPDVDGALVGGASLKARDFGAIIEALQSTL